MRSATTLAVSASLAVLALIGPTDVHAQTAGESGTSQATGAGAAPPSADAPKTKAEALAADYGASPPEAPEEITVTGSFLAPASKSATKLNISVLDTPLSVSSYTADFLKAIDTESVGDLYKYMTGVQRSGNTGYDISIRGFRAGANDYNVLLTDGLPGLSARFSSPPTIGVERIDAVKGPSSVLNGQAQPGGVINLITKKPSATFGAEAQIRINDAGGDNAWGYTVSGDVTGPISEHFLARLVAEYSDPGQFRRAGFARATYVAPSFTWLINDQLKFRVQEEYRHTNFAYDQYLVSYNKDYTTIVRDVATRYQEPNDYQTEDGYSTTGTLDYAVSDDITARVSFRDVRQQDYAIGFDTVGTEIYLGTPYVTRRARQQTNHREYDFGDANLTADFDVLGFENKLVGGVQGGRSTLDAQRNQFYNAPGASAGICTTATPNGQNPAKCSLDIPLYNTIYGRVFQVQQFPLYAKITDLTDRFTTTESLAGYFSDLITLTPELKLLVGLRYTTESQDQVELFVPGTPPSHTEAEKALPLVGLDYEPTENLTFYASYATSLVPPPSTAIDENGTANFLPETAQQEEVGIKGNFLGGRLLPTLALFNITRQNVISTATCPATAKVSGTCSYQVGEQTSRGIEAEIDWQPLDHWQITAGYSFLDAKTTKSRNPYEVGSKLVNVPVSQFHLWTRYDFTDGMLEGLGVGGGLSYLGDRAGTLRTADYKILRLPGYATVDLAAYYKIGAIDLTLKVGNLFNAHYYESAGFTGDIQVLPGAPRYGELVVRWKY